MALELFLFLQEQIKGIIIICPYVRVAKTSRVDLGRDQGMIRF
jgi:hypothetical protein